MVEGNFGNVTAGGVIIAFFFFFNISRFNFCC